MASRSNVRPSSGSVRQTRQRPRHSPSDPAILERLAWVQNICLALSGLVAAIVLCGWLLLPIASLLFHGWGLMKANTALLVLLSASSLTLSRSRRRPSSPRSRMLYQVLAAIVLLVAAAVLAEYLWGISIGIGSVRIDTLLAADRGSPQPGRMSPQTASAFVLLGPVLLFLRVKGRIAGWIADSLVFCLCLLVIFNFSGYAFGAMHFFGVSPDIRTSPQTLLALTLLSFVAFSRRAEIGSYSVLLGSGIGSRTARIALPLSLVVPFVLETTSFRLSQTGVLTPQYASALVTALAAITGFVVILLFAWHIDTLEQAVRDISLRDELTGLYNRRGLFLIAERQFRLARRARSPFSVLFLDLDGLKQINDRLGHESGSDLLRETAALIDTCFRESDVVGRIGGDEFVVAGAASEAGMARASHRLQQAAADRNGQPGRPYAIEFSLGIATTTMVEGNSESMDSLMKRADEAMYLAKRSKHHAKS